MKKKLVITESQLRMLQEQEWEMSSKDNANLVEKANKDLSNFKKVFDSYYNMIIMVSISDIMNDMKHYEDVLKKLDMNIESVEGKFNYYFNVVESYDFFERPDEISTLDDLSNDMQDILYDLKNVKYVLDEMLDSTKKISDMKPRNVLSIN